MTVERKINIAGPCAAESRNQVIECARAIKERGIEIMRASLWKPRTRPGFEGVGSDGIAWLSEVTKSGITVGTEVMLPEHVTSLIDGIVANNGDPTKVLLWLGSRNQNHLIQREIAKRMLAEAPENVRLLIKNQPWSDEAHWLGIVDHVTGVGIDPHRVILCHRGFLPNGKRNPNNLRNMPDFEMVMRVREKTGLPMVLDPSHIGGNVDNVFTVVKEAARFEFDGLMVEVHPEPQVARTDARQQLTFQELDRLLGYKDRS
ncbi:hypothetical protein ACFL0Y_03065 [Patescibacteria group bacterium]